MEQELPPIPEHMCSLPVFSWVDVGRSLVFLCSICRSLFVLLFFLSFGHGIVCPFTSSDYPFDIFKSFI